MPFSPDVVFLRVSGEHDAQDLIESCRQKWNGAWILALFCRRWRLPAKDVLSLLNRVDDFLSCSFQETEFSVRVVNLFRYWVKNLDAKDTPLS